MSEARNIAAAVGTFVGTLAVSAIGVVTLAALHPEIFEYIMGNLDSPYVITQHIRPGIWLPRNYHYHHVLYDGVPYTIFQDNNGYYYLYDGIRYSVYYR